ncbi:MAG: Eco57I restriction-modification methylase domain-containing protein, partial [Patescibacteria group bacterium]|nr:Eco57I restriction-modification methylase domain-containing protein [Patescibacteria group bacterium]
MVGNSLIETINGFDPLEKDNSSLFNVDDSTIDEMQSKLHSFFKESDTHKKNQLQKSIELIIDEVLGKKLKKHKDEIISQIDNISIVDFNNKQQKLIVKLNDEITLIEKVLQRPTTELFFYKLYFKEVLDNGGFDVVIGNPPYIKEYENKLAFERLYDLECYQGKMDIWYMFGCKGIELLKENGILSYIAPNNWITNSGASKLRNNILQNTTIKEFVDFGSYMVFDTAKIQTMIMILKKEKQDKYDCNYSKVLDKKITKIELENFLNKKESDKSITYKSNIDSLYLIDKNITFIESYKVAILNKIESSSNFILDKKDEITNGLQVQQELVNKNTLKVLGDNYKLNQGIFNLTTEEKDNLNLLDNELELIKPLFTSSEISRYSVNKKNKFWVIYTDSRFKNKEAISPYPNIKKHLDKFQKVITSSYKPYGIHRTRNEKFFIGEKIISLRKCVGKPSFSYINFDSYVNQAFYIIQSSRINMKYLTALLNSKLIAFWLKHKGKMQGDNYQIDKEPIMNIPIKNIEDTKPFEILVDYIMYLKTLNLKEKGIKYELMPVYFEQIIDGMVYELYFEDILKKNDRDIIRHLGDLPDIEKIKESDKLSVIFDVFERLDDLKHKVRNNLFYMDNIPEIKIIEGK